MTESDNKPDKVISAEYTGSENPEEGIDTDARRIKALRNSHNNNSNKLNHSTKINSLGDANKCTLCF